MMIFTEAEHPDRFDNAMVRQTRKMIKAMTELEIAWVRFMGLAGQEAGVHAKAQANRWADALGMEPIYPAPLK